MRAAAFSWELISDYSCTGKRKLPGDIAFEMVSAMKSIKRVIPLLLLTLLASSCQRMLLYAVYGIKQPKPETAASIKAYGREAGYNVENQFYFIDSSQVRQIWKGRFPKAYIYDNEGYVIKHLNCFASGLTELQAFYAKPLGTAPRMPNPLIIVRGPDTLTIVAPEFSELKANIHDFSANTKVDFPEAKYYIVFYWSKAFGRVNKNLGAEMEKYISEHPEFSTVFVKINCDFQKEWGYKKVPF